MTLTRIEQLERQACYPESVKLANFNPSAEVPFGITNEHICSAMNEFIDFLGFIGQQLATRNIPRLETMLMQANFSSMVGEFMGAAIPKYCQGVVRNNYHNGHPDLIPASTYPQDSIQYADTGVEIKASRYLRGWQGHNAEESWLMVFCFDSSRPVDAALDIAPKPFEFLMVAGAQLEKSDWTFAGRSETSRRTITASINKSGYQKMTSNWIYRSPKLR
jgi:hypothetical protein